MSAGSPSSAKASAGRQKKEATVASLTEKLGKAKSVVLADYTGLKHKQLEELRKVLAGVEAEFVVTKNKLLERALGDTASGIKPHLTQATAILVNYGDEIAGIRELIKFFKSAGLGNAKAGLLGSQPLSGDEVKRLSDLPSREILLGQLVRQLNAPIQGLHYALSWNMRKLVYALSAVKEKKG
ncbi:50S ribosomal protein L10 [Candidatus Gottesmanbacteria bacterium RBG_16_52_11]|uniref:Large ribosomal subunit protein uL10 n=1 Tax=Candidatus Gottesmanbacteria bacterium RBG_16_52_11 TaxID=1798374 RepID=A0A1F5YND3_9BACT|nr:MAG: 50S ribosomal protein L10 [Candidatus Gottesmanbacteria bacterium RBG_16_52_11]